MEHFQKILCRYCNSEDLQRNGKNRQSKQCYRCKLCKKSFILNYTYNAYNPGVKEQVDQMLLNSSGTRDIGRVLKISKDTVTAHIKKKKTTKVNPNYQEQTQEIKVALVSTEWDEFWSYVGKKKNQRWTWYLINRNNGDIIAWENGRRTDKVFQKLLDNVKDIPIKICHTDNWAAYSKLFPKQYEHIIGKDNTWRIERKNLNFRTNIKRLNRKTICFSKDDDIHDKVISMYIEKYYFKESIFNKKSA